MNEKGSPEELHLSNFSEPPASAGNAPTYAETGNRRKLLWCTWGLGGVFLLISALIACLNLNTRAPEGFGVFGTFWASGWAASHHLNPYAEYSLTLKVHPFADSPLVVTDLNLSPPALLPFFQIWADFRAELAVKIWTILSLLIFLGSSALLLREYGEKVQHRQLFWLLFGPAASGTLVKGQDYAFLLGLSVGVWLLLRRERHVAAGICMGILVAAKPNYALWPIFLAFCGYSRTTKVTIVTTLILCCLPALLYGPGIYAEWLHILPNDPHWIFPPNVSLTGLAARFGHRIIGQVLSVVLLVFSCVLVARKRPSVEITSGIALCVAMLAAPVAWVHYSLVLAPVLLQKPWSKLLTFALAPLLLPASLVPRFVALVIATSSAVHLPQVGVALLNAFYFAPICFLTVYFLAAARDSKFAAKQQLKNHLAHPQAALSSD